MMRDAEFMFGRGVWRAERSVVVARPVVHFEVIGSNPDQLRRYYADLFEWAFDTPSPVAKEVSDADSYGFIDLITAEDGSGIRGGGCRRRPGLRQPCGVLRRRPRR
jgi:predicted enzyme related to lactoylglutathione lyase